MVGEVSSSGPAGPSCVWIIAGPGPVGKEIASRMLEAGFEVLLVPLPRIPLLDGSRPSPRLVVTHHAPPHLDGVGVVERFRERSLVPVIVVSARASMAECERAMRAGANRFLPLADADADEITQIGLDLVSQRIEENPPSVAPVWTAAEARRLRDRELFDRLDELLFATRGNIAEMARRIGKDRSTVRYHLQRFGMLDRVGPATRSVD